MNSFTRTCALAALATFTHAEEGGDSLGNNGLDFDAFCSQYSAVTSPTEDDCLALPYYALILSLNRNYSFERFTTTTDDGYILSLARITTSTPGALDYSKGPVLLRHGYANDGIAFFN